MNRSILATARSNRWPAPNASVETANTPITAPATIATRAIGRSVETIGRRRGTDIDSADLC